MDVAMQKFLMAEIDDFIKFTVCYIVSTDFNIETEEENIKLLENAINLLEKWTNCEKRNS